MLEIAASNRMDTFSASHGWVSHFKIPHGDDDNADEEWLSVVEDVSSVKFSDYIFIDQDIATCSILNIEEMFYVAKNINNGEEAKDNVHCLKRLSLLQYLIGRNYGI
ncbi:hypothetical protein NPIL_41891 [Nephila pilipes]|uniref:HTH CENPB-type domain-containing protein n=1 Tax=Nephila pilipes TaxID=299642 RepID=A0A8X6PS52_NEPPI|nr:hypothetical protein NPIL_41891 [Nephila pilipes]